MSKAPYELQHDTRRSAGHGSMCGGAPCWRHRRSTGAPRSPSPEREALGLTGLLPTGVSTLEGQLRRVYAQYLEQSNDLRKWVYLANLRDRNEVLFYRLLTEHISEMLPVVYTPTVGLAIERFSQEFRRTRGVYLSVDHPEDVETALRNTGLGPDDVDLLVATDSEGILGIGDQGVGGIEISIGKLAVYTAAAGIHPRRVLPVVLDMGTDNLKLLNDDMYLGARHARIRDQRYDDLIDAYVTAVSKLFPNAMLHWEDFGATNARRILNKYADQVCTFNDDMQGTAATVLAAAFSAVRAAGSRIRDQRVVIYGAGTAGLGIADMMRDQMIREGLSPQEATDRFYPMGSRGLMVDDAPDLLDFQQPYARRRSEVADWAGGDRRDRPGRGGQPGTPDDADRNLNARRCFHRGDREGHGRAHRPADHHAVVEPDLQGGGAAGGPDRLDRRAGADRDRQPVRAGRAIRTGRYQIAQANNALVFPGLGLGVVVAKATRISDRMIAAAADAVARMSDATTPGAALLPPMTDLRTVSAAVAIAVATAAAEEGLAQVELHDLIQQVHDAMWRPEYPRIESTRPEPPRIRTLTA